MLAEFQLQSLRHSIAIKESSGLPTEKERELYHSWLKFPEYLRADKQNIRQGIYKPLATNQNGQEVVSKIAGGMELPTANYETNNEGIMKHLRGRPRKVGEVSRTTAWRREKQGVLLFL